jgi:hypothetical protein
MSRRFLSLMLECTIVTAIVSAFLMVTSSLTHPRPIGFDRLNAVTLSSSH